MKKNMAVGDRFLRFLFAVVMIVLFFITNFPVAADIALLLVAGIFIATAFTGRCLLYALLGIDTRQFKH